MLGILFLTTFIATLVYLIVKITFYWRWQGVKQCGPLDLWRTFFKLLLQFGPECETLADLQKRYPEERYIGINMFTSNLLLIKDPGLVKEVAIKEFDSFVNHYAFVNEEVEPLFGRALLLLQGERWRSMRSTLSPSFTSSKMRGMFRLFEECTEQFIGYLQEKGSSGIDVELKDLLTRFSNDVIASAAFGLSCNSLKCPENEFYLMGKELTNLSGFWKNISLLIVTVFPRVAKFLGVRFFNPKANAFFRNLVKSTIDAREKSGILRPDMIHLLLEARKGRLKHDVDADAIDSEFASIEESAIGKEASKIELSDDDLIAQALLFFFAGFESVANLMCFTAHELTVNCDVQTRLQEEIDETLRKHDGVITYESLLKMKYLDMVLSESLRKYPSITLSDRVCTKPFTIEPVHPGERPVHLQKGTIVGIPIFGMHRDPKFYPNPERYDPERFSDENKSKIEPGSYLPFGIGPRSCIGNRFGLLEAKMLIFKLFQHFNVVVIKETQVPIKLKPNHFSLSVEGFWVGLEPRP
ncbi:hypothetical protein PPYR_11090 [Photinus pyralis]|uniref:Cytochrome P450 n=1 Tax=Photinus pyralis TaxID=7054 RepID=A0A5N4AIA9_PHOPY|nr:cytochrome P450 9e2-like [Photinus pyralis]XP_031352861.1 cytochrome P450 9e2-like [Photinus pyralis]KAB0797029.1 hypothetical protein PPYR_11090 [Photinus pyralis]